MNSEWIEYSIGDLCKLRAGIGFSPDLQGRTKGEYPFVKVSDMNLAGNETHIRDANNWVNSNDLESLKAKPHPSGATVFAKIGVALTYNRRRMLTQDTLIDNNMMSAIPDVAKISPQFLYYLLIQVDFNEIAQGTALPYLNASAIQKLRVLLPPLPEQKAIARVLGSLDDKIELNRRMNTTLELLAQTLFRAWFVDFEPVKAKVAGLQPVAMDAETAALFPAEFEESVLGPIPKGWKWQRLEEAFEINPTRRSPGSTYLDMSNVPTRGHRPQGWTQRAAGSGMKFINGDTLLARITPCLENGKTAFVDFLKSGEVAWGSTEFIVLRPRPPLPEYFGYLLSRHEDFRAFAIQSMTGTSGRQRVQVSSLGQYTVAVPSTEVGERFAQIIDPMAEQIKHNSEQSQTLAQLRDSLLPRLISGQVRVPEAMEEVKAL